MGRNLNFLRILIHVLCHKSPCQYQQCHIRAETDPCEYGDGTTTGAELSLGDTVGRLGNEELAMTLVAAVGSNDENGGTIYSKQCADRIELGGEDLKDDEGE